MSRQLSSKSKLAAVNVLDSTLLKVTLDEGLLSFDHTDQLFDQSPELQNATPNHVAWKLHSSAQQAATLGLEMPAEHSNLLVLGDVETACAELVQTHVNDWIKTQPITELQDVIATPAFDGDLSVAFVSLPAGTARPLQKAIEQWLRKLQHAIVVTLNQKVEGAQISNLKVQFDDSLNDLLKQFEQSMTADLNQYFTKLRNDFQQALSDWAPSEQADGDPVLEHLLSEGGIGRYRVNVLQSHPSEAAIPFVLEEDPTMAGLFGGVDGSNDSGHSLHLKLRPGSLFRAHQGVLLLHLRDLLADEHHGQALLEKLYRFCRHGQAVFEDGANNVLASHPIAVPVTVKLIIVASREDYHAMLDEQPEWFSFFPIKVEFVEHVKATQEHYLCLAQYVAVQARQLGKTPFSKQAVMQLFHVMHRLEEDQTRFSTKVNTLKQVMVESLVISRASSANIVALEHVKAAMARRHKRHSYIEGYVRESIVDQELMINVEGELIGQINGLTHIDIAEASFGSPIRISANCYPGLRGVVTIDREVTMSGPSHDKGVLIMQSWLQQHFANYAPLNFTASLVFEQEYEGVDGDSASCAELFTLMSALTQLPINQSIAVTGGMNQQGEVLPVGGLNEKIEGYFRVCQAIGLNGKQGVLMPAKNARHLVLSDEVVDAVNAGQFKIATMSRVEEGLMYLTDAFMEDINHHAAARLAWFKTTIETNKPSLKHK